MKRSQINTRLPVDSDLAPDKVRRLTDLINDVYDAAESDLWKRKGMRTDRAEVEHLLRERALILAEIDGELIGAVSLQLVGAGAAEFGMLVASPKARGQGAGSALIAHAERWAREQGCHTMRLKVLAPRTWLHPGKEFLRQWYAKLGYTPCATEPFELMHPERALELTTECDYTVCYKPLAR